MKMNCEEENLQLYAISVQYNSLKNEAVETSLSQGGRLYSVNCY